MQESSYFFCCFYSGYIEWKIVRQIWIGFYNNQNNEKCKIQLLPKDIVGHIITFLGTPMNGLYVEAANLDDQEKEQEKQFQPLRVKL